MITVFVNVFDQTQSNYTSEYTWQYFRSIFKYASLALKYIYKYNEWEKSVKTKQTKNEKNNANNNFFGNCIYTLGSENPETA